MKKLIIVLFIIVFCMFIKFYPKIFENTAIKSVDVETIDSKEIQKSELILHAGGVTPDGAVASNSFEAINYSYDNGYRILEIDFCWTEDNNLVCVHDWECFYTSGLGKDGMTFAEFEKERYDTYNFTSLTLDHLCEWLKEHNDVVIVTDIKERCVDGAKLIADKYPELKDNFYIQIYNKSDYVPVQNLGFKNIIWTLYQLSWEEKNDIKSISEFVNSTNLTGLTFPKELIDSNPDYLDNLLKLEAPLFVHTVNDKETQTELLNKGVSKVYADYGVMD